MKNKKIILILFSLLFISLCDSNILTFYEERLMPQIAIAYLDNTVVFRLVERLNVTCNVPRLTFRILYPNGTDNSITIYNHQIPSFNFCVNGQTRGQVLDDQIFFTETI